jgi:DNA-binding NarL/FixJ family response regulator
VVQILVIDKHGVYRTGLRALIETRIHQARVVEANDLSGALRHFETGRSFDLVLVDADLSGDLSMEAVKEVRELYPAAHLAVISASNSRADVLSCLSTGFHGYICKLQSDEEILEAINDLLSGRIYVPRWLAECAQNGFESSALIDVPAEILRLTPRQNEVLGLLAQGKSNKEIAQELNISEGTTKIHTAALLRALGARNRTEAAFKAANFVESNKSLKALPKFNGGQIS